MTDHDPVGAAGRFLAEKLDMENATVLRQKLDEARELIRMLKNENHRLREELERRPAARK